MESKYIRNQIVASIGRKVILYNNNTNGLFMPHNQIALIGIEKVAVSVSRLTKNYHDFRNAGNVIGRELKVTNNWDGIGKINIHVGINNGAPGAMPFAGLGSTAIRANMQQVHNRMGVNTTHAVPSGKVYAGRGNASDAFKRLGFDTGTVSPKGNKALNSVVMNHEMDEARSTVSQASKSGHSFNNVHLSPAILLKEHNNLKTLRGPGSREARTVMGNLRNMGGEQGLIDLKFPGYEHGKSPRLSRHAIRRMTDVLNTQTDSIGVFNEANIDAIRKFNKNAVKNAKRRERYAARKATP